MNTTHIKRRGRAAEWSHNTGDSFRELLINSFKYDSSELTVRHWQNVRYSLQTKHCQCT
jgi:hypothetical protein